MTDAPAIPEPADSQPERFDDLSRPELIALTRKLDSELASERTDHEHTRQELTACNEVRDRAGVNLAIVLNESRATKTTLAQAHLDVWAAQQRLKLTRGAALGAIAVAVIALTALACTAITD